MLRLDFFDYEFSELGYIRDSFIKGLKAYFSASNPYFVKDIDSCAKDDAGRFFRPPANHRTYEYSMGDYYKAKDEIRLKDATIFFHHYLEQMLKLQLEMKNPNSNPYQLQCKEVIKEAANIIKAVSEFWDPLHRLNHLRNILYHGRFTTEDVANLLGSDLILFSNALFKELEYDFQSFFPYNLSLIQELVIDYGKDAANHFKGKQFRETYYRIRIMANINWFEQTGGKGELDEKDQKARDFEHGLYQNENITELPCTDVLELQCPICKNMMILVCDCSWEVDYSLNTAKEMFRNGEWPFCPDIECIYCFYCGFFIPKGDCLVDFSFDFPYNHGHLIEDLLNKWERNGLK